jgi:ribonuclease P protein subunit RPR2
MASLRIDDEIERWVEASARSLSTNPNLAKKQAVVARKLRLKTRARAPYELRLLFCKKCKQFSPPVVSTSIRVRKGWLVIRCHRCGGVYRKRLKD